MSKRPVMQGNHQRKMGYNDWQQFREFKEDGELKFRERP
jgi:hypothetical protein